MQFKYCSNCRKQIACDRFDLHESFCMRRNKYCQVCGECYDIQTDSDHPNLHQKITCDKCGDSFQASANHDPSTCISNTGECIYCLNSVRLAELTVHQRNCGSRTEKCEICFKSVVMSEMPIHIALCTRKQTIDVDQIEESKENIRGSKTNVRKTRLENNKKNHEKQIIRVDSHDEDEELYEIPRAKKIKKPEPARPKPKKTNNKQRTQATIDSQNDQELMRALAMSFELQ